MIEIAFSSADHMAILLGRAAFSAKITSLKPANWSPHRVKCSTLRVH